MALTRKQRESQDERHHRHVSKLNEDVVIKKRTLDNSKDDYEYAVKRRATYYLISTISLFVKLTRIRWTMSSAGEYVERIMNAKADKKETS